jgi:hypothetical protein
MTSVREEPSLGAIPAFDRHFFTGKEKMTVLGSGSIGGKARGLVTLRDIVESEVCRQFSPDIDINIPTLTVIATDFFDLFMEQNDLHEIAYSETRDDVVAHAFQKADLPAQLVGDLRALITQVHTPLAVRSSSLLEDALHEPFAGVYSTKMIPNNQHDAAERFRKLVEAVKFVYASTFFNDAKSYVAMTHHRPADEKMAVILQEVVGTRFSDCYYPHISGVGRSFNHYPTGNSKREDGVVELALGLGRTIVDDGVGWAFSPSHPTAAPPYKSITDMLKQTQLRFWAVNMGTPPAYDPIKETEYLIQRDLENAEYDGSVRFVASTYDPQDGRIFMGVGGNGPRLVDFAPILKANRIPLSDAIQTLLRTCADALQSNVEIEFAVTLDPELGRPARLGMLQVRPMLVSCDAVELSPKDLAAPNLLLASDSVLGNGVVDTIRDIVYVKRRPFSTAVTQRIPALLAEANQRLVAAGRPYLLIGFGRWGTTDPQAGIPVEFSQISGAKAIVEATLPELDFSLSQGSHFFHNVTSFQICYFSVPHTGGHQIDWDWLDEQTTVTDYELVRHCELSTPLEVKVDGKRGLGLIRHD